MKIVAISHSYIEENPAGGEYMLHGLLRELASRGHNVYMLAIDTKGVKDKIIDGVKVMYHIEPRQACYAIQPDVIITQFHKTEIAKRISRKMNVPLVTVIHNNMDRTRAMVHDNKSTNLLVFNTEWIKNDLRHNCRSIVVHPPLDERKVSKSRGEHITLVNIAPEKGVGTFYALAEMLPQYKFLGVKGGYWKNLQDVRDMPNVEIIESTSNMRDDVYARSRIVLMPSSYESFGMVALEAIASGIPVIAHPTMGLKECLGNAGIFIDRDDHEEWAVQVKRLMEDEKAYSTASKLSLEQARSFDHQAELDLFVKEIESYGRK